MVEDIIKKAQKEMRPADYARQCADRMQEMLIDYLKKLKYSNAQINTNEIKKLTAEVVYIIHFAPKSGFVKRFYEGLLVMKNTASSMNNPDAKCLEEALIQIDMAKEECQKETCKARELFLETLKEYGLNEEAESLLSLVECPETIRALAFNGMNILKVSNGDGFRKISAYLSKLKGVQQAIDLTQNKGEYSGKSGAILMGVVAEIVMQEKNTSIEEIITQFQPYIPIISRTIGSQQYSEARDRIWNAIKGDSENS